jgi:hypothetical protein
MDRVIYYLLLVFLSSPPHFFFKLLLLFKEETGSQCFFEGFLFLSIQASKLFFFYSGPEMGMNSGEVSPVYVENGSRNLLMTDHKLSNI